LLYSHGYIYPKIRWTKRNKNWSCDGDQLSMEIFLGNWILDVNYGKKNLPIFSLNIVSSCYRIAKLKILT